MAPREQPEQATLWLVTLIPGFIPARTAFPKPKQGLKKHSHRHVTGQLVGGSVT